jgi:orotate phosphoribosyltransferase
MSESEILAALPARSGHFRLESGLHTDCWLTLDGLFVDGAAIAPLVAALADRLRRHRPTGVCGPLLGGAFLAQLVASRLGARFYYAERRRAAVTDELFRARYELPIDLARRVRGERIALIDDAISGGSSVRATATALAAAGASIVAVGALLVLGDAGVEHFTALGIPIEALDRRPLALWQPSECPLCRAGMPLEDPSKG